MINRNPYTNPSEANPDVRLVGVQYEKDGGAAYGDHIKNTAAICNTSASHTYGNVMGVIQKYLIDTFPPDTFKTVTRSSTLASRQLNHLPQQLHKNDLPQMVLVPRISFGQDENRFLAHTLINSRYTNTHSLWGDGSLLELGKDPDKRLWIHGHYNRAVMFLDVILSFDTLHEQTNFMHYTHNMMPIGHNHFIKAPLELYIPGDYCSLISNLAKIPIVNKIDGKDSVQEFTSYMNTIWHYPITYKLKGGSNSNEFFLYYVTDIDVLVDTPQLVPGTKDGHTVRNFGISFSVRCEFNTIGYFTLNSPEFKATIQLPSKEAEAIVPIFSDQINLDDFDLPQGWMILTWPIFTIKEGMNSISIDDILNESLRRTIDHHLAFGIPIERFLQIQFRENGHILNNEYFYINWEQRRLILTNPNHLRTYRLIVTFAPEYMNNLLKELYNLE